MDPSPPLAAKPGLPPHLQRGRRLQPAGLSPFTQVRPRPRPPPRTGVYIVVGVALCGVLAVALLISAVLKNAAQARSRKAVETPVKSQPAVKRTTASKMNVLKRAPAIQTPEKRSSNVTDAPTKPSAILNIPGATITTEGDELVVVFDEALFASGTLFNAGAEELLAKVSQQLTPYAGSASITIIGCTDDTPVNPKGKYKDNRELGLLRATEVLRSLQASSKIPAAAFKTLSYGTQWTPFPNDSPANRARNRTAVLKIRTG